MLTMESSTDGAKMVGMPTMNMLYQPLPGATDMSTATSASMMMPLSIATNQQTFPSNSMNAPLPLAMISPSYLAASNLNAMATNAFMNKQLSLATTLPTHHISSSMGMTSPHHMAHMVSPKQTLSGPVLHTPSLKLPTIVQDPPVKSPKVSPSLPSHLLPKKQTILKTPEVSAPKHGLLFSPKLIASSTPVAPKTSPPSKDHTSPPQSTSQQLSPNQQLNSRGRKRKNPTPEKLDLNSPRVDVHGYTPEDAPPDDPEVLSTPSVNGHLPNGHYTHHDSLDDDEDGEDEEEEEAEAVPHHPVIGKMMMNLGLSTLMSQVQPKKRGRPRKSDPPRPSPIKRPPGRPRIHPRKDESEKKPRGRPRKHPKKDPSEKKPRGRPPSNPKYLAIREANRVLEERISHLQSILEEKDEEIIILQDKLGDLGINAEELTKHIKRVPPLDSPRPSSPNPCFVYLNEDGTICSNTTKQHLDDLYPKKENMVVLQPDHPQEDISN